MRPAARTASPDRRVAACTAAVALTAAVSALLGPVAQAAPPAPLRVQPVEIIDRQGFERPLRAATMWLPAGFRHESQVAWSPAVGGCQRPYHLRLQAQSADGRERIELLPGEGWGRGSFGALGPGCPLADLASAEAYLRVWVQRHRPGARWLGWQPRVDGMPPPMSTDLGGGTAMRQWHEAGRARIAYVQEGRPVQEIVAVAVSFGSTVMPSLAGQAPLRTMSGEALGVLAWRTPEGQHDAEDSARRFDALWATLRTDPAWAARVQQGMGQIAQDNARTQAQISQIHAETSRQTLAEMGRRGQMAAQTRAEIAALQQQGYDSRSASQDRQQTATVQAIRGVQPWRTADGPVVELPNTYAHAWKLKDGSYVLSDSPAFDPGRDLGIEGRKMQRVP